MNAALAIIPYFNSRVLLKIRPMRMCACAYDKFASFPCCLTAYLYALPAVRTSAMLSSLCRSIVGPTRDPSSGRKTCTVAGYEVSFASSKRTSYGSVQVGDMTNRTELPNTPLLFSGPSYTLH